MTYENLLFRRQFLLTPNKCASLNLWQHKSFGIYQLYAHPDIELNVIEAGNKNIKVALLGFMINPNHPEWSNIPILNDIINTIDSIEDVSKYLHSIAGRFVLIISTSEDTFLFHDPCGLRTAYYTEYENQIYVGSQPLIFEYVMPVKGNDRFMTYEQSAYKKNNIEHWIPSGCSLYENIHQLMPNHYLRFSSFNQVRYWPSRQLQKRQLDDVVPEACELLVNLMNAGHNRFKLALPLTAGWDSRTLLSACKNIAHDLFFYTNQRIYLSLECGDIKTPKRLLQLLGYYHHLIDCTKTPNDEFLDLYKRNTSMPHEDSASHVYGMYGVYPSDRVRVKGNCSEIARCYFYMSGKHQPISSVKQIIELVKGWCTLPFVNDQLADWFSKANPIAIDSGVDILDLFYWEHRMGSWQAQGQLEYDIVQETYTPFNHRGLLELMLGVSPAFRSAPNYVLYRKMCKLLWPEVLTLPINPPDTKKEIIEKLLLRWGLYDIARQIYHSMKRNE